MTDRVRLSRSGPGFGSHSAYFTSAGRLVVEWYEHGDHAPYEFAEMLIFDTEAARALLGLETDDREAILKTIGERFDSYFEAKKAAVERRIPFKSETDFWP